MGGQGSGLAPGKPGLVVPPGQDEGLVLASMGRLSGGFLVASEARPPVTMLLEAREDSKCSGVSNTVAMDGTVDFPKKKLAHQ